MHFHIEVIDPPTLAVNKSAVINVFKHIRLVVATNAHKGRQIIRQIDLNIKLCLGSEDVPVVVL